MVFFYLLDEPFFYFFLPLLLLFQKYQGIELNKFLLLYISYY